MMFGRALLRHGAPPVAAAVALVVGGGGLCRDDGERRGFAAAPAAARCEAVVSRLNSLPRHATAGAVGTANFNDEGGLALAADVGGTNTRLMLYRVDGTTPILEKRPAPGALVRERKFKNAEHESLTSVIRAFLDEAINDATTRQDPRVRIIGSLASNRESK